VVERICLYTYDRFSILDENSPLIVFAKTKIYLHAIKSQIILILMQKATGAAVNGLYHHRHFVAIIIRYRM